MYGDSSSSTCQVNAFVAHLGHCCRDTLVGLFGWAVGNRRHGLLDDLGAAALFGEDFEEEGVGDAAVDEVDFADAGVEGVEGGADFGDHAAGDGAVGHVGFGLGAGEGGDEGGGVLGVAEEAGDVGDVNEFGGFEGAGEGGGGEVGVDVEGFAGADFGSEGGEDGDDVGGGGVEDVVGEAGLDLADAADVGGLSLVVGGEDAAGLEDAGAGDAGGAAAVLVDEVDELGIDRFGEGFFDDGDGLGGGDAEAADELGLESGVCHGGGDGLAAAVDDDGVDAGDFEESDVPHDIADQFGVLHGGAAHFDEEGFSAIALQVGQGFDEGGGFGGGDAGHRLLGNEGVRNFNREWTRMGE